MSMYDHLKEMMAVVEAIGEVNEIHMGDWLHKSKRIDINGKTADGKEFTLTLEIEEEGKEDVV